MPEVPQKPGGVRDTVLREAGELGVDEHNFVKEALKWQYNWIGLAGAAAFALVSGSGLPLRTSKAVLTRLAIVRAPGALIVPERTSPSPVA